MRVCTLCSGTRPAGWLPLWPGKLIGLQDCSLSDLPLPLGDDRLEVGTGIAATSLCQIARGKPAARVGEVQTQYCFPFFVLVQLLNAGDLADISMATARCKADPRKAAAWLRVFRDEHFKEKRSIFCLLFMSMGSNKWCGCCSFHLLQVTADYICKQGAGRWPLHQAAHQERMRSPQEPRIHLSWPSVLPSRHARPRAGGGLHHQGRVSAASCSGLTNLNTAYKIQNRCDAACRVPACSLQGP